MTPAWMVKFNRALQDRPALSWVRFHAACWVGSSSVCHKTWPVKWVTTGSKGVLVLSEEELAIVVLLNERELTLVNRSDIGRKQNAWEERGFGKCSPSDTLNLSYLLGGGHRWRPAVQQLYWQPAMLKMKGTALSFFICLSLTFQARTVKYYHFSNNWVFMRLFRQDCARFSHVLFQGFFTMLFSTSTLAPSHTFRCVKGRAGWVFEAAEQCSSCPPARKERTHHRTAAGCLRCHRWHSHLSGRPLLVNTPDITKH